MYESIGVLVVSSNEAFRGWLVDELAALTLPAQLAASATLREARSRLASRRFLACVTDDVLRDGSGFALSEWADSRGTSPQFIICGSDGTFEATAEAAESGATFLVKPPSVRDLAHVVGVLIARSMWEQRSIEERVHQVIAALKARARLSQRHCELLDLLPKGLCVKEMAQLLGTETSTVSTHLNELKNRVERIVLTRDTDQIAIWILEQALSAATRERWGYQSRVRGSMEGTKSSAIAKRRPAARAHRSEPPVLIAVRG
jgi:DNA-binding NarL/FixJ family response regulator